ncbi:MAG: DNA-3-methyladenine glycosylase [Anaerolineales bacterium]
MPHQSHPQATTQAGEPRLSRDFFARSAIDVARQVLGTKLVRLERGPSRISGWITEAEAYIGPEDLASHARHGRTDRNAAMWGEPGHAYVYFTYGIHWMLNLVTEVDGRPGAVLVRGMLPDEGLETIRRRRNRPDAQLTDGPAKLCQALAIDGTLDGHDLCVPDAELYLTSGVEIADRAVTIGPRVGLNHVPEPWLSQPWRFRVNPKHLTDIVEKESGA